MVLLHQFHHQRAFQVGSKRPNLLDVFQKGETFLVPWGARETVLLEANPVDTSLYRGFMVVPDKDREVLGEEEGLGDCVRLELGDCELL